MSTARFADRTVWISGAASGLGAAAARAFATEGARVFAADVNEAGLAATVEAIRTAGGAAAGGRCDVSDAAAVEASVAGAVAAFGGLDVAVHAAGIGRSARLEEIDVAEWERVLSVNLTGAFLVARATIPRLLERRGGNLVNVASTAGLRGQAYAAHYAASKAGLINFTRSIALEFAGRGLRANCLAPAGIVSPLIANFVPRPDFDPSLVNYYLPPVPGRMSQPEEVARAILFLASDECPMITGATLLADWGTLA